MMEWYQSGGLLIGLILGFMAIRMPAGFAFLMANLIGMMIFVGGEIGLKQLVANATNAVTTFTLVPIPLFLLMGELFFRTGIAVRVFEVFDRLLGGLRGRLAYITVGGGAIFAALSGSSIANTAMLGSTMLPEMTKRGYRPALSMGPIIATGGLAILIPPSALAVLLGATANIDIGQILIAGIVPGLLLAAAYAAVICGILWLDPDAAPSYSVEPISFGAKVRLVLVNLVPMAGVIFMVVGLIVLGIATPSEAAAFGVLGVLVVAVLFRALTWRAILEALRGSVQVSGMVFLIIIGSSTFSQILALSGASSGMLAAVTAATLSPMGLLLAMMVVLLLFGMLMESVSIIMLTAPIFFPLAVALGFDPIWFAILVLLMLEISLATPPFGMALFVLLGVAPTGTRLSQVVYASMPYIAAALAVAGLIILFPQIVTFVPGLMR